MSGCNAVEPIAHDEIDCLVTLKLAGEIISTESPLTKASTDDIYLVQVYKGNDPFAFGIFDDSSNIKFNLKKGGESFRIIVSLIKNGKSLTNYVSTYNMLYGGGAGTVNSYAIYGAETAYYVINNTYYNSVGNVRVYWYDNQGSWTDLPASNQFRLSLIGSAAADRLKYPECADWFYGEINEYSPTGEYETLSMELKRVGFKLKYELTGVTDGEVTVKVYNDTKTFIDNTTSTSTYSSEPQFYAFYEARNAWLYSDEYMENMTLAVSWKRGVGITESFGTKTIQIKRNCLNNIKINLGSNDQQAGMNMTVESESTIGTAAVTIPVE